MFGTGIKFLLIVSSHVVFAYVDNFYLDKYNLDNGVHVIRKGQRSVSPQPPDELLFTDKPVMIGQRVPPVSIGREFCYPPKGSNEQVSITHYEVLDQEKGTDGALAFEASGGTGQSQVCFVLKSLPGLGINYEINVYGYRQNRPGFGNNFQSGSGGFGGVGGGYNGVGGNFGGANGNNGGIGGNYGGANGNYPGVGGNYGGANGNNGVGGNFGGGIGNPGYDSRNGGYRNGNDGFNGGSGSNNQNQFGFNGNPPYSSGNIDRNMPYNRDSGSFGTNQYNNQNHMNGNNFGGPNLGNRGPYDYGDYPR